MPFKFNWLTFLANIFSFQLLEISEYQPSSSYLASKSQFPPDIDCKFCKFTLFGFTQGSLVIFVDGVFC